MDSDYETTQPEVIEKELSRKISNTILNSVGGTKPWLLFSGIGLIIFAVFTLIDFFSIYSILSRSPTMLAMGIMYLLTGIVQMLLGIHLIKYNFAIDRLLISREASCLEASLAVQRKFWKLAGVFVAISLALLLLKSLIGVNGIMLGIFGVLRGY
ncbi:hypothetical protein MNBD_GAMMA12-1997 [hydrothermal vent metagenome]|uniref:Uncharacterized protein n=1 Tax=hydrothermal vent metagenome TaxID=652676 RepID=A0A3B0Z0R3_9ZZZZ